MFVVYACYFSCAKTSALHGALKSWLCWITAAVKFPACVATAAFMKRRETEQWRKQCKCVLYSNLYWLLKYFNIGKCLVQINIF